MITKILLPRYIDLADSQFYSIFPQLLEILKFQGWVHFVSQYKAYYLRLVSQFFQNLKRDERKLKMWTTVENIKIRLNEKYIRKILDLPEGDVNEWSLDYDVHEAYSLMTYLPCDRSDSK